MGTVIKPDEIKAMATSMITSLHTKNDSLNKVIPHIKDFLSGQSLAGKAWESVQNHMGYHVSIIECIVCGNESMIQDSQTLIQKVGSEDLIEEDIREIIKTQEALIENWQRTATSYRWKARGSGILLWSRGYYLGMAAYYEGLISNANSIITIQKGKLDQIVNIIAATSSLFSDCREAYATAGTAMSAIGCTWNGNGFDPPTSLDWLENLGEIIAKRYEYLLAGGDDVGDDIRIGGQVVVFQGEIYMIIDPSETGPFINSTDYNQLNYLVYSGTYTSQEINLLKALGSIGAGEGGFLIDNGTAAQKNVGYGGSGLSLLTEAFGAINNATVTTTVRVQLFDYGNGRREAEILYGTNIYTNIIQKIGPENVSLLSVMTSISEQPKPNDAAKSYGMEKVIAESRILNFYQSISGRIDKPDVVFIDLDDRRFTSDKLNYCGVVVAERNGNAIIHPLTMEDKITANKLPFGPGIIYSDTVYESTGFLNGGEYVADGLASQVMDNIKSTPLGDK